MVNVYFMVEISLKDMLSILTHSRCFENEPKFTSAIKTGAKIYHSSFMQLSFYAEPSSNGCGVCTQRREK